MSQMPNIQLEAPKVIEQPKLPVMYQEGQVVLPQATVGVGYAGINYDMVLESAAKLGVGIVETINESDLLDKQNGLEAINQQYESSVKKFADVADFATIDYLKSEHWHAVKDLLGFDPEDPQEVGSGINQKKILGTARAFNAKLDDEIYGSQKGWRDNTAIDNYVKFSENEDQFLASQGTQDETLGAFDQVIERRIKQYQDLSGGRSIDAPLPTSGYTMSQRKLLTQISKDYTSLLEKKDKIKVSDPIQGFATAVRPQFDLSSSILKEGGRLIEMADKIDSQETQSENEKQLSKQLRADGIKKVLQGQSQRHHVIGQMQGMLRDQWDRDTKDTETADGYPSYLTDPSNSEAIDHLISLNVIKPEDANAIVGAYTQEQTVLSSSATSSLEVVNALRSAQLKNNETVMGITFSTAKKNLKELAQQYKTALDSNNFELADALKQQHASMMLELQDNLRKQVSAQLPKEAMGNQAFSRYAYGKLPSTNWQTGRNQAQEKIDKLSGIAEVGYQDTTVPNNNPFVLQTISMLMQPQAPTLDFSEDSYRYLNSVVGSTPTQAVKLYAEAIKGYNGLAAEMANDLPVDKGDKERRENAQSQTEWAYGLPLTNGKSVTGSQSIEWSNDFASRRLGITGPLPDWKEAEEILKKNQDDSSFSGNSVPFNLEMIKNTKLFKQIIDTAGQMSNKDEAYKYIQDSFNLLLTNAPGLPGTKLQDLLPDDRVDHDNINVGSVTAVVDMNINPTKNKDVAAFAFMLMPKTVRSDILTQIETKLRASNAADQPALEAQLAFLKEIHGKYEGQQSVLNYLQGVEASNITPARVAETKRLSSVVSTHTKSDGSLDKDSFNKAGADKKLIESDTKFISFIAVDLFPKIYSEISFQGLSEADKPRAKANIFAAVKDIAILSTLAEAKGGEYNTIEVKDAVVAKVKLAFQDYRFDANMGALVRYQGETVAQPAYTNELAISPNQVIGSTGIDLGQKTRHIQVALSSPSTNADTEDKQLMVLSQFASTTPATAKAWSGWMKENPFVGSIVYSVAQNKRISSSTIGAKDTKDLTSLVTSAIEGQPKDNLTIMAATAAIAQISPSDTNREDVIKKLRAAIPEIRKAYLSGDTSVYKTRVVGMPAFDGKGSALPTIVISKDGKDLSTFQPSSVSYSKQKTAGGFTPEITEYLESRSGVGKGVGLVYGSKTQQMMFDPAIDTTTRDNMAIHFLTKSEELRSIQNNRRADLSNLGTKSDEYWKEITPDNKVRIYKGLRRDSSLFGTSRDTQDQQTSKKDKTGFGKRKLIYEEQLKTPFVRKNSPPEVEVFAKDLPLATRDDIAVSALASEDSFDTKFQSPTRRQMMPLGTQWDEYWTEDLGNNTIKVYRGTKYTSATERLVENIASLEVKGINAFGNMLGFDGNFELQFEPEDSKVLLYSGPKIQRGGTKIRPIVRDGDTVDTPLDSEVYGQQAQEAVYDLMGILTQTENRNAFENTAILNYVPFKTPPNFSNIKPNFSFDANYLVDRFEYGEISTAVVSHNNEWLLIENSARDVRDITKETPVVFGTFKSESAATQYNKQLTVYLDKMYKNYQSNTYDVDKLQGTAPNIPKRPLNPSNMDNVKRGFSYLRESTTDWRVRGIAPRTSY